MEEREDSRTERCLTEEEALGLISSHRFVKVDWRYKNPSFIVAPKEIQAEDRILVNSPDLGSELVQVLSVSPISLEQAMSRGFRSLTGIYEGKASPLDIARREALDQEEKEGARRTQEESDLNHLGMKVMGAFIAQDRSRVLITYTAPGRVDFRDLVRTMASFFHMRVEFRQVFARDAAKILGGLGVCGLPLCCHAFLNAFGNITISMAKTQLLSLSIPKLSGQCGRLMCCLEYENDMYEKLVPMFPRIGATALVEGNLMKVVNLNVLSDSVVATDGDRYEVFTSREWAALPKAI